MSDLIERQAAIDALACLDDYEEEAIEALRKLPSAQPTQTNASNTLKALDCVRRQDAINLLKKWSGGYDYIELPTHMAVKSFEQLPSAQRTGRWIPLSDKWPDKYGNYLVSTSSGCIVTDYYASYGWDDDSDRDYVIAWMPLPEPYKEEE